MNSEIKNKLDIKIRSMTLSDLPDVVNLERSIFPDPWSLSAFEEQISGERSGGIIAESNGKIIGYACYYIVLDESHLTNLAVASEYRRKSVAKQLLENILQVVTDKKCKLILLEVRPSNVNAIGFYERYKFSVLYRRPNYYRKPVEDALVMVRYIDENTLV